MIPLKKILESTEASLHVVDGQFLFVWSDRGERRYKFVSPAAVRSAVAREPVDTGWIAPAVKRCGSGASGDWAVAWFPPAARKITVVDAKTRAREITIPLPGLLFAGVGKRYAVWATRGKTFATDAPLFRAPLPNVGGDEICFGANRVPPASAATIERAFAVFCESPFNGHSVEQKSTSCPNDVRDLLFELARTKARSFPERDLMPAGTSVARVADAIARGERRR